MKSKRGLLAKLLVLAAVIAIAAAMFVIGRGHTVYFDNKEVKAEDGTVYKPFYKIEVYVGTSASPSSARATGARIP